MLPIAGIVLVLCFALVPVPSGILLCFLAGAVLLTVGMMFFNLGAEMAMSPIGERVGPAMTKSRKLWVVLVLAFLLGVIITVSEPDLQVLAELVPSVPNEVLILFVAAGVGVFLAIAILRMLFGIALPVMLVGFYALVFFLAFLVPEGFRAVAFDSGGVTTGPMTVPFIMALGVGISAVQKRPACGGRQLRSRRSLLHRSDYCGDGPRQDLPSGEGTMSWRPKNIEVPWSWQSSFWEAFLYT